MDAPLLDRISRDLTAAMRAGDEIRVGVLRMLRAAIHNVEIEKRGKGGELSTDDVAASVAREAKKRREAMQLFTQGGRNDLAKKEESELAILKEYLPEEATEDEVRRAVAAAVDSVKPAGPKDFGRVMGEAMKTLKGRAEADRVSSIVRELLE